MLPEKTARMMYVKNREKIIRHKRGSFIANFYTNFDVLIKDYTDSKAEFVFNIPRVLAPETLDVAFSEALAGYLKYGKNHESAWRGSGEIGIRRFFKKCEKRV